jgi:GT2 family glycosyltransferase
LGRLGRTQEAIAASETALETLPFNPLAARDAALLRVKAGDREGARKILSRWQRASLRVDLLASYREFFGAAGRDPERLLRRPLVSVVIPLYNYGRFIRECIQSVLTQTYDRIEILVVDHGSTDDGPEKAKAFGERVRLLHCPREGTVHNTTAPLNMGIRAARGEFIAWLNADDLFLPEKIERQVDAALFDDRIGLVYSDYICEILRGVPEENLAYMRLNLTEEDRKQMDQEGRIRGMGRIPSFPEEEAVCRLLAGNFIIASTTLIRKALLEEMGYFDETLPQSQDYAMWLKIFASGWRAVHVAEALGVFRIHETNTRSWRTLATEINGVRRAVLGWPIERIDPRLKQDATAEQKAAAHFRLVEPLLLNGMLEEAIGQARLAAVLDPGHSAYQREQEKLHEALSGRGNATPNRARRRLAAKKAVAP